MKITEHLTRGEIACKCRCGFGLHDDDFYYNTALAFEQIRKMVCKYTGKDTPIRITSGCRCKAHNDRIEGSKNSQHIKGRALDLECPTGVVFDDFKAMCEAVISDSGGVGSYPKKNMIHIDLRGERKRW